MRPGESKLKNCLRAWPDPNKRITLLESARARPETRENSEALEWNEWDE